MCERPTIDAGAGSRCIFFTGAEALACSHGSPGRHAALSALNLVDEFAEPWCLGAAEIVTASAPADQNRLLDAARIVSAAAADPLDEDLRREASAANAELERYFKRSLLPMAGPVFVALSKNRRLPAGEWLACVAASSRGASALARQTGTDPEGD